LIHYLVDDSLDVCLLIRTQELCESNPSNPTRVLNSRLFSTFPFLARASTCKQNILPHGLLTKKYTRNQEYESAVALLEQLELSPETEAMWSTLCQLALEDGRLIIAERCCAALGDTSRAMFLRKVNQVRLQQSI
jgi:hypothetical protein